MAHSKTSETKFSDDAVVVVIRVVVAIIVVVDVVVDCPNRPHGDLKGNWLNSPPLSVHQQIIEKQELILNRLYKKLMY